NNIDFAGAQSLANALSTGNTSITELNLWNNDIDNETLEMMNGLTKFNKNFHEQREQHRLKYPEYERRIASLEKEIAHKNSSLVKVRMEFEEFRTFQEASKTLSDVEDTIIRHLSHVGLCR